MVLLPTQTFTKPRLHTELMHKIHSRCYPNYLITSVGYWSQNTATVSQTIFPKQYPNSFDAAWRMRTKYWSTNYQKHTIPGGSLKANDLCSVTKSIRWYRSGSDYSKFPDTRSKTLPTATLFENKIFQRYLPDPPQEFLDSLTLRLRRYGRNVPTRRYKTLGCNSDAFFHRSSALRPIVHSSTFRTYEFSPPNCLECIWYYEIFSYPPNNKNKL